MFLKFDNTTISIWYILPTGSSQTRYMCATRNYFPEYLIGEPKYRNS